MANPQVEDGYTSIANELLEALLKINLSMYEFKVILAIMRKTYGWSRKTDIISHSQIADITNIKEPHVNRTIKYLVDRNIIKAVKLSSIRVEYSMQKNYHLWDRLLPEQAIPDKALPNEVLPSEVLPEMVTKPSEVLPEQVTEVLPEQVYTKTRKNNTTIKTNTTKENVKVIFYSFKNNQRYQNVDFENEFEKFCEYWLEGKRKLQRPKLACHNWLDNTIKYANRGNGSKPKLNTQPKATEKELLQEWGNGTD
jgi:phage replication O-like protein O